MRARRASVQSVFAIICTRPVLETGFSLPLDKLNRSSFFYHINHRRVYEIFLMGREQFFFFFLFGNPASSFARIIMPRDWRSKEKVAERIEIATGDIGVYKF